MPAPSFCAGTSGRCAMSEVRRRAVVVVSGLSGSGKSVALNALEDHGYFCVDNLPGALLPALAAHVQARGGNYHHLAAGIDARAGPEETARLPELINDLAASVELIFLTADNETLIRRFSETRRRHPLADGCTLAQAIERERAMLEPLAERAEHVIDTSELNIHQLRRRIWELVRPPDEGRGTRLVLESFGYKRGVPRDVDLVFDARCLPNPHWKPELRAATGLEQPVREYLGSEPAVADYLDDVDRFVHRWLPAWTDLQRSHITIAIGCTGGKHRSVYLVDRLVGRWRERGLAVTAHHRELER